MEISEISLRLNHIFLLILIHAVDCQIVWMLTTVTRVVQTYNFCWIFPSISGVNFKHINYCEFACWLYVTKHIDELSIWSRKNRRIPIRWWVMQMETKTLSGFNSSPHWPFDTYWNCQFLSSKLPLMATICLFVLCSAHKFWIHIMIIPIDGSRYIGEWNQKGQKHGLGHLLLPDGTRYGRKWKEDWNKFRTHPTLWLLL